MRCTHYRKTLFDVNVIIVDIVNGLCGHNYEYGTAHINYLCFCMHNKQNNSNMVRKHEARGVRMPVCQSDLQQDAT